MTSSPLEFFSATADPTNVGLKGLQGPLKWPIGQTLKRRPSPQKDRLAGFQQGYLLLSTECQRGGGARQRGGGGQNLARRPPTGDSFRPPPPPRYVHAYTPPPPPPQVPFLGRPLKTTFDMTTLIFSSGGCPHTLFIGLKGSPRTLFG